MLVIEGLLGIAHLLWPEIRWGQGRESIFNLENDLTLASWLASMQLIAISIASLIGFHQDRWADFRPRTHSGVWLAGALVTTALSVFETTRLHHRLHWLGDPDPDIYGHLITLTLGLILLALFGWFLWNRLDSVPRFRRQLQGWLVSWGLHLMMNPFESMILDQWGGFFSLIAGLTFLAGCTLLLLVVGAYILRPRQPLQREDKLAVRSEPLQLNEGWSGWILSGVGVAAFTTIVVQVILFQLLLITSDYLTANLIIATAVMGSGLGGLVGFSAAFQRPRQVLIAAGLLLPLTILLAFGAAVSLTHAPLIASVLMMSPFVGGGIIIATVLALSESHRAYAAALIGAGLGALAAGQALHTLREESSLVLLSAFGCLAAVCSILTSRPRRAQVGLLSLAMLGAATLATASLLNLPYDWLNVVRTQLEGCYPEIEVLFSRSSLVGRYDVVRREPDDRHLKTYENGRVSDTIRPYPVEQHQIDPRLPHTLYDNPTILIIGVSGDAITKSARFMSTAVYGAEINPAIVDLQTHELVEWNADSYAGINVAVMDGRSYVAQFDQRVDVITLLNTHFSRGGTAERAASPEYLYTAEAINEYLDTLDEDGVLIVEEPVEWPEREPPVWKLLYTMRQVLLARGFAHPDRHFFITKGTQVLWLSSGTPHIPAVGRTPTPVASRMCGTRQPQ